MRIAILSDQHGRLPPIPKCDLMILSGDICRGPELIAGRWRTDLSDNYDHLWLQHQFAYWLRGASFTIAVAGNHDTCIEKFGWPKLDNFLPLHEDGFEAGGLKFWGAPWVCKWDALAYGLDDTDRRHVWNKVPEGVDVLVCHGPPLGYGDRVIAGQHVGCRHLANTILRVQPKLVTCGHIHEGRGTYKLGDTTIIINAASNFVIHDL